MHDLLAHILLICTQKPCLLGTTYCALTVVYSNAHAEENILYYKPHAPIYLNKQVCLDFQRIADMLRLGRITLFIGCLAPLPCGPCYLLRCIAEWYGFFYPQPLPCICRLTPRRHSANQCFFFESLCILSAFHGPPSITPCQNDLFMRTPWTPSRCFIHSRSNLDITPSSSTPLIFLLNSTFRFGVYHVFFYYVG